MLVDSEDSKKPDSFVHKSEMQVLVDRYHSGFNSVGVKVHLIESHPSLCTSLRIERFDRYLSHHKPISDSL